MPECLHIAKHVSHAALLFSIYITKRCSVDLLICEQIDSISCINKRKFRIIIGVIIKCYKEGSAGSDRGKNYYTGP